MEIENERKLGAYWKAVGSHDFVGANVLMEKYNKKDEDKYKGWVIE